MTLLGIWSVVGPLVGTAFGAYLSRSAVRKHWLEDNKRQEFHELLSALLRAHNAAQLSHSDGAAHWDRTLLQSYTNAIYEAGIVLEDRLFINEDITRLDLKSRWEGAMGDLRSTHDHRGFSDRFEKIKQDIIRAAR